MLDPSPPMSTFNTARSNQTHIKLFSPTVSNAVVLATLHIGPEAVQVLTGHCMLNYHSPKIKKRASVVCECGAAMIKLFNIFFFIAVYTIEPSLTNNPTQHSLASKPFK